MISVNDHYECDIDCIYKGEHYSVRNNGAVMRHHQENKRRRKNDDVWTFGNQNSQGYMELSGERVHRIVATAFHGAPPAPEYIVDHKDTNRANNRPENLRWLTRLENVLSNHITLARIELICGSVENFLNNPSLLRGYEDVDKNFSWMRAVSPEEGKRTLQRLSAWARKPANPKGGQLGEWIFKENYARDFSQNSSLSLPSKQMTRDIPEVPGKELAKESVSCPSKESDYENSGIMDYNDENEWPIPLPKDSHSSEHHRQYPWEQNNSSEEYSITKSITPNAVQIEWFTPSEFPCCPESVGEDPLTEYARNLKVGEVFCKNDRYQTIITDFALVKDKNELLVVSTSDNVKPWGLAKITYQDGVFIHSNEGTFYQEIGAQKYFTLAQGKEWTGGECLDDDC